MTLGEHEDHRRNPLHHLRNMDLAGYDREYAPEADRAAARGTHLRAWPEAVEMAIASLDRVPQEVADGLLGASRVWPSASTTALTRLWQRPSPRTGDSWTTWLGRRTREIKRRAGRRDVG